MRFSCKKCVGISSNFCLIPGVDQKWRTKPIMQICNERPIIWSILKYCSFAVYLKKTTGKRNRKRSWLFFFLKITSNHIRLSLKKSMDLNEEKALSLIFCCSKLKRRRLPSITFKIIPWAIDWGCYSLFLDIKKCSVIWSIFFNNY